MHSTYTPNIVHSMVRVMFVDKIIAKYNVLTESLQKNVWPQLVNHKTKHKKYLSLKFNTTNVIIGFNW